jgi:hypothetical protein
MTGDEFEGKGAGNVHPTTLKDETFSDERRVSHNAEDLLACGEAFELAVPLTSVKRDCDMAAQRNPAQHP